MARALASIRGSRSSDKEARQAQRRDDEGPHETRSSWVTLHVPPSWERYMVIGCFPPGNFSGSAPAEAVTDSGDWVIPRSRIGLVAGCPGTKVTTSRFQPVDSIDPPLL